MLGLISILLFVSSVSEASTYETSFILKDLQCQKQWSTLLPDQKDWLGDFARPKMQVFKVYNLKAKAWDIFVKAQGGHGELRRESEGKIRITKLDNKCKEIRREHKLKLTKANSLPALDDKKLEELKKDSQLSLIYVWSPEMTYSVTEHNRFSQWAKKKGYRFVSVVDPLSEDRDVSKARVKYGINEKLLGFQSTDLLHRGATLHFPTSFLVGRGQYWGQGLVGVVDEKMFNKVFVWPAREDAK